ncbi:MAG: Sir2 family NAD-dependent protein deacetylase, partial [Spirochaetales bacterium]|nr:Sir2 family NAD-dependent protein deacetylase [Spirochaetales bacterium]
AGRQAGVVSQHLTLPLASEIVEAMPGSEISRHIEELAGLIIASKATGSFTGAGISTESGIPDFRGPQGMWKTMRPIELSDFLQDPKARREYWRRQLQSYPQMRDARPNEGHRALARLYKAGYLKTVITQNIDGLHQKAGIPDDDVIELHGTNAVIACLNCGCRYSWEEILPFFDDLQRPDSPRCDCGGWLKPATISFGQAMPIKETEAAFAQAARMDVLLVIGSSLQVYPAAGIPGETARNGGSVAIINAEPTVQDSLAKFVLLGRAGQILSALAARVIGSEPESSTCSSSPADSV